MDDPELDPVLHAEALDALARIHRVSGTVGVLARFLRQLWESAGEGGAGKGSVGRAAGGVTRAASGIRSKIERVSNHGSGVWPGERRVPIRILDVGCGDGAVLIGVGKVATALGIPVRLYGCDFSARALDRAREKAIAAGVGLRLTRLDVTRDPLPHGFDLVTCALFLHHFDAEDAVRILGAMRGAGSAVLVQDLLRTRFGYLLAWAGVRVLSRSPVARLDGPLSVRGAYTADEVLDLCARAGMGEAVLRRAWPERFVVEWTRPQEGGRTPDPVRTR